MHHVNSARTSQATMPTIARYDGTVRTFVTVRRDSEAVPRFLTHASQLHASLHG